MAEPAKIFIIDDEQDLVRLTAKRIQACGYRVTCFYDGQGVVEAVEREQPSLILLDIWLPDISGVELFRKLRKSEQAKHIPVLFFSANSSKEDYCLNVLRAEGFVKKPYHPEKLLQLIEQTLKNKVPQN